MNITARPMVHFGKKPAVQPKQQQHAHEVKEQVLKQQKPSYPKGSAFGV
ncbi:MAG: hypothetical protein K2X66_07095 [Cyanobacteria bacterium]|nr:hypothetical protein [Cyanobacteriota bacterium]